MKNTIPLLVVSFFMVLTGCTPETNQSSQVSNVTSTSISPGYSTASSPATTTTASTPPTLDQTDPSGAENSLLSFSLTSTNPSSLPTAYSCVSDCPSGLSVSSAGAVTWTPNYGQAGTYNVVFGVSDGIDPTSEQTIQIIIAHTNRPPVIHGISTQNVNTGSTLTITPSVSDPDGDTTTLTVTSTLPNNASFNGTSLTFSPSYTQAGQYSITFQASDGALTATESVTINVNYQGTTPVMASISGQSAAQNQAISFSVSASDADGATMTYSASNLPSGATFSGNQFIWTPGCGQNGTYTPTFTATDPDGNADSKTPTITISSSDSNSAAFGWEGSASLSSGTLTIGFGAYSSGPNGNATNTYSFIGQYDCYNIGWTTSLWNNVNPATIKLSNTNCTSNGMATHFFVFEVQNNCGNTAYEVIQVEGCNSGLSLAAPAVRTYGSSAPVPHQFCAATTGTTYSH